MPLYAAGRLATLLIPRSAGDWVFGCGAGIGDGALAVWQQTVAHGDRTVWLVGSTREQRDAAAHGIPTLPKHSLRGFWRTARARVVVVTHGFGDVNRYAIGGAFIVQLWHGIPLKRIGIDSPETVRVPAALERMPGARLAASPGGRHVPPDHPADRPDPGGIPPGPRAPRIGVLAAGRVRAGDR
ncbi:CDP-glycerol glycerophosphotransferase family protein [Microbacterium elymi]|uniref:CDP-glycerol glycerophosphotransferase family protein n=1 Tax=Microbacterium elymi TaxID=2909587 RepID=A0ABY5NK13_9MICO|nr:CDP-glycerol glycerophosphotransferase family protein [Microbacterium elymi]UUT35500.1 CDP-glycerol glycerophosphotransferase family protein [Microbacterium elymi]